MKTFIAAALLITATGAFAQSASEEAIILNQELQFLEDSVDSMAAAPTRTEPVAEVKSTEGENSSLEQKYFSDEERDVLRTKRAAPKRRSF